MLTNSDVQKLETIFATKAELTKCFDVVNQEIQAIRAEITSSSDMLMHELKAIREELTVGSYRRSEQTDTLENHETRITTIKEKLSF